MASIDTITLESDDPDAARRFYDRTFGPAVQLGFSQPDSTSSGFRGFTLSLVVGGPATVDGFFKAAVDAGARAIKPVEKSFWGYGGTFEAPDGAIWTVATSTKRDDGTHTRQIDDIVLQIGAADVKASKQFYVDRGFGVEKSFGRRYVQFEAPADSVTLALYGHRALAKTAGVEADGTGSHRLIIGSEAGPFTDPDGFDWHAR